MEDQSPTYSPQPPPPATPQLPQSPVTSEKPPPTIPPPPNSQYSLPPSQNTYSSSNSMPYPSGDRNQLQVHNHSQGRPNYGQGFQAQSSYQPSQSSQQSGQFLQGPGRGESSKKQGQQLWHRMKRNAFYFCFQNKLFQKQTLLYILKCQIREKHNVFNVFQRPLEHL